jgi:hypothetical protein
MLNFNNINYFNELCILHSSPDIIRQIKLRRMWWGGGMWFAWAVRSFDGKV